MAFTVQDFEDLIQLLDQHPQWLETLRQRLLTRELLKMPETLQQLHTRMGDVEKSLRAVRNAVIVLAKAQRHHYKEFAALRQEFLEHRAETDRRFAELAEAQRHTEEQVGQLAEAQRRHYEEFVAHRAETNRRFAELAEAQRRAEERIARLEEAVSALAEAQRHAEERLTRLEEIVSALIEAQRRTEEQVRELAEAQRRAEERIARLEETVSALIEAQRRTEEQVRELAEAQRRAEERIARLEETVSALIEAQRRTEEQVRELAKAMQALTQDVAILKDRDLRRLYVERAAAYFGRPDFRKVRALSSSEIVEALEQALDAGEISPQAFEDARLTDVAIRGQRRGDVLHVVLEVSWVVDRKDVERSVRRAEVLRKVLGEVWPGVAGSRLTKGAQEMIRQMRAKGQPIVVVRDGHVGWPI